MNRAPLGSAQHIPTPSSLRWLRLGIAALGVAGVIVAARHGLTPVAAAGPTSASFLLTDVVTQGNWKGVYGGNGESIANDSFANPAYAAVSMGGFAPWTWAGSSGDVRALRQAASATNRIASTWYASASFTIDVNISDNASHQVALYVVDWDNLGRAETIEVLDGPGGSVLDTRSVAGLVNGQYLVWRVTGHPVFRVTRTAGVNAIVSGIFFDGAVASHAPPTVTLTQPAPGAPFTAPAAIGFNASVATQDGATVTQVAYYAGATQVAVWDPMNPAYQAQWTGVPAGTYSLTAHATDSLGGATISSPVSITVDPSGAGGGASATFVQTDVTTKGNWPGAYGAEGSTVANDHTTNPFYAQVALTGQASFTWAAPSNDVRALVTAANPNARIASTFYASTNFSIDVNLTDAATHQIALYAVDWDNLGRSQTIQVLDADSLGVLDTRTVSAFTGGQYLVWNVAGHVKFQMTRTAGANAVVSGIFFDTPLGAPVAAAASFVSTDTSTKGDWPGHFGAEGFNVVNNQASYPAYAHVTTTGVADWTWNGITGDGRALRKATDPGNAANRIAATLYSGTSFSVDVNLVDGLSHQVALYVLDYDSLGRSQMIEALDAVSGNVLDTQTVPAFTGGQYWVYRVAGHVKFRLTRLTGANAVMSGIFFDVNPTSPPAITSNATTTFKENVAGTFTVTTTGTPTAAISKTGALPGGVTLVDNGNGTATLSGTPGAGTAGNYPLTITANNGIAPNATQNFVLTVASTPAITSANATTFAIGGSNSFTVTTSGFPAPSIARGGAGLPAGVSFLDNGNGTGTLSGTPAAGTGGGYALTFTATNAAGSSAAQNFTLTVSGAPAITSANSATFNVGAAGTFTVTATGSPSGGAIGLSKTGALPTGVTFVDNANGTATLSGTAAAGTGGVYPITITANNGVAPNATQTFTLTVNQAPAITSANIATFIVGTAGTFTVTTSGTPSGAAIVLNRTGTLPTGVTFTDNANGTATIGGTPAGGTGGTYPIVITANNGVPPQASQNFTLTVNQAPAITSANNATFTVGSSGFTGPSSPAVGFSVTTTGFPTGASMLLSETGALPSGITFTDNHNGTATIAGTPAAGTGGTYPITITANNGVAPNGTQSFTLTVRQPPAITSASSATFVVGSAGTFGVTTSGFPSGASMALSKTGALPTGVTFTDNGNGTATIAGTPAGGTSGSYPITITANNGVAPNGTQSFTLTVNQAPAITSANATTFTVGAAGTFTVTTTGLPTGASMLISESGALPGGVTFVNNNNGTATLAGTPNPGTGGTYPITITANNGVAPNATQNFTLTVNQAPAITSADHATATVGSTGILTVTGFSVTTTGFPSGASMVISKTGALPTGITFTNNGNGTATIAGSPAAGTGGTYPIVITASNGVAPNATQNFTLTVNEAPAITSSTTSTFTVGTAGSFAVTTTGFPTGASMVLSKTGTLPSNVTFTDNGNGTATIAGTPAAATGGSYPITITANNGVLPNATQNFTLIVNQAPVVTSAPSATFTVGTPGSFTVTTSGTPTGASMLLSEAGSLPSPITFTDNHNGTATIAGTPAAGTGGSYAITITANNGVAPNGTQSFTLNISQPPAITSASSTTFTTAVAGTFSVTTTGFPTGAAMAISETGTLPGGVTFVNNNDGTATLAGTPNANTGGTYPFTITANNGIAPNATQSFTLTVNQPPVATADGAYVTDANTAVSRATSATDDLLDNDAKGFPVATITTFGGGSLGGAVTDHAAGTPVSPLPQGGGSLSVGADGSFSLTPPTNFTGVYTVQYRLHNAGGDSDATVTFNVRPKAVADTLIPAVVGNVSINTAGTPFTIATNDIYNGTPLFVAVSGTTAHGGQVALTAGTGTFIYNPPPGYAGGDSFTYTVTDNSGFTSSAATVNLTVSGMIWFVNNAVGSNGDGRLSSPFNSLQNFVAVNDGGSSHPKDTDSIFLYESITGYSVTTAPFFLRVGQRLIGQDHLAMTLAQLAGVTVPAGSATLPAMNSTGGQDTVVSSQVYLANNSQVHGLGITIATPGQAGLRNGVSATTGVVTSELRVNTTSGTAVQLSDISGTFSFTSISASSVGETGAANGIFLQNQTGSFTVTGDGSNTAVGGNGSGGFIKQMSGADGTTNGIGIYLNNVQNVTLRRMMINGSNQNYGIRGFRVNGFTLEYSTVNGNSGTAATFVSPNTAGEGSVYFGNETTNGIATAGTFTKNIISGGRSRNLSIINTTAGTTAITIKGNTFGLNQNFVDAQQSLAIEAWNAGTIVNATVGGTNAGEPNTFTGSTSDVANFTGHASSTMDVQFIDNAVSNNHPQNAIGGSSLVLATGGTMTFNVDGNSFRDADGDAISLQKADVGALLRGKINDNTIGVAGDPSGNSGSHSANGVFGSFAGTGTITLSITNNDIRQYAGTGGLYFDNTGGSYTANFTITGNTTAEPGAGAAAGLAITDGAPFDPLNPPGDTVNVCAAVTGNDFSTGDPNNGSDVLVGASGASSGHTFRLPGYGGATLAAVQSFIQGNNLSPGATVVNAYVDTPVTAAAFVGGASCPTPP